MGIISAAACSKRHNIKFCMEKSFAEAYLSRQDYQKWLEDIERFDRENEEFSKGIIYSDIKDVHDAHVSGYRTPEYPRFLKTKLKRHFKYDYKSGMWK